MPGGKLDCGTTDGLTTSVLVGDGKVILVVGTPAPGVVSGTLGACWTGCGDGGAGDEGGTGMLLVLNTRFAD